MQLTKKQFKKDFEQRLHERFALDLDDSSNYELYYSLGSLVKAYYGDEWRQTNKRKYKNEVKELFYFSIEFLPGRLLKSNLLNLGIIDTVREGLADLGLDLDEVATAEPDMALGNGGLGRLASCFMDSLATCDLPGNGNGVRYDYGLFKQKFVDGYQVEIPDNWLKGGNAWEVRKEHKSVTIGFGGQVYLLADQQGRLLPHYENQEIINAVPYDTAMVGYESDTINTMRLWKAEIPEQDEGKFLHSEQRESVADITAVLYPDDSSYEGRLLRLKQEYFFVSAGIQSIVRYYKGMGWSLDRLPERIAVHINDTHPALCIPELMRILLDENAVPWEMAWNITVKVMSYTNHTIMAEALEKWTESMVQELLPRIYQIIYEIDQRFINEMTPKVGYDLVKKTRIIQDGYVHMANMAIIGSHSTNGVAKLHSDLLKNKVLHDFYVLYPERFNNKTNGIAERRWLQLANEPLSQLLDKTIGTFWRRDPKELSLLKAYQDDPAVLNELTVTKELNKQQLAAYCFKNYGIELNTSAIFDVQIKRLHAYKRQLLNLMHILKLYFELKEDPDADRIPRVFIFGAKAAPSYHYAKAIIKCINAVASLINQDANIQGKLKVIFLENYNVSLAELIIPAADVSEQISLASKEASGTSNMKLMLNGAVTVATLDGANVEIKASVGNENIFIFGLTEQEVYDYYESNDYAARKIYDQDPVIKHILDAFVDGTIPGVEREGKEVFDSLIQYNDEYFILQDFPAYCHIQEEVEAAYRDREKWAKMSLINIANAGNFSADDTVKKYAEDIWHISK